mmetsp:Transcript_13745/g.24103  ORF Transcript_13745/g.24103 Transcript_13745/m.24103 type:complete len:183 (-) Transcript_13745:236-784(-)|eukprot:CAMPEP_0119108418 /NCGR_PEP_ID=MMETSP1180-20130426/14317_1 /TAXON_ID=3052 ORGANISM="Chlamydomonas cf sp, Strain CCMP681" /NCGR_SAMPLE_ID=MMETSP1180 /ASSEMBLY_ACC=CAM_ASM_000741 /LENGTH=182 /DNA_ID=CAMNT_0007094029 /DNA_START=134 /DNA_END=682 /DNA_ORIENTATION=+
MSDDTVPDGAAPAEVPRPPRKRAQGPRFDALPEFRNPATPKPPPAPTTLYPTDPVERLSAVKEARIGPLFIRSSLWVGGGAIFYTYLAGFRSLMLKNKPAWENTFRQRVFIMSPLITMYCAGYGILPLPFRATLERLTGRPTLTLADWEKVENKVKEDRKGAKQMAETKVSEAKADAAVSLQ